MIEKLCSIKTLKKIDFQIYYIIDENEQLNINKKSFSVEEMSIKMYLKKIKIIIYITYKIFFLI